jgi:hypothetical protein
MMSGRKQLYKILLLLFVGLAACSAGWAQATGSLVGTATDKGGAVVPGVKITLTDLATNETKIVQSDGNGNFQFLQLLPGNYRMIAEHAGFQAFDVSSVQVTVGNATRVDAALQVGQTTQTVEVAAQAALLDTQSSSLDYTVQSSQVEQLPLNGRDVLNLAELVPGVVPQGGTSGNAGANFMSYGSMNMFGNYQIGGGTSNQSAIFIDGAPINGSMGNAAVLVPTQDSIQEFQVATNNVSTEYGRFAGGVINMATKSGTNQIHGTLYEYVRNAALNANLYFDKQATPIIPRPIYTQNQYGVAVGGPVIKDKAFFFLSWEQFDLTQGSLISTQVPTANMIAGDFSAVPSQLYDPNNQTCAASGNGKGTGTSRCAYTAANGYVGSDPGQVPGAVNQIPLSQIPQATLNLSKLTFAPPTNSSNPATGGANFQQTVPLITDTNQWIARGDQNIGHKNKLFERYTNWHFNKAIAPMMPGTADSGVLNWFGVDQAVVGDTITINPTMIADVRASFVRFFYPYYPSSCCNFNFGSQIGTGWANLQSASTFPQLPTPNITGMFNLEYLDTATDTDEAYILSGAVTKTVGRHTITFGAELRRQIWDYVQSNSAGTTFNSPSGQGYTSSSMADSNTGYGFASFLVGYPTYMQAAEPARTNAVDWYAGLYVNDSVRWTPKLTINAGLRWEQPGSFTETHGKEAAMLLNLPQPAVSAAMASAGFSGSYTGGLGLINSSVYPHKDWQELNWKDYSPRVGFAYSPTNMWVFRGGFGMSYLPAEAIAFDLGPFDSPINLATTTVTSTGATPTISLANPFPQGIATPSAGGSALQADINSLLGSGISGPLPIHKDAYQIQWNIGFQKQFGSSASVNVGYVGSRGNHNPLFSLNHDQLPDQYDVCGTSNTPSQCNGHYLTDMVLNPLSAANGGPIAANVPTLGASSIPYGYLLKPAPQYLYMSAYAPTVGFTFYQALQVLAQKRLSGGILSAAWTFSNFVGTTDSLTGWVEGNVFGAGGTGGIQDNTNIGGNSTNPGEYSRSAFQTPNRVVINYVYPLPFGRGKRFLSNVNGTLDKIVGNWTVNGLTTFQAGFPIAFADSSNNALVTNFAAGYVVGENGGASRPDFVAGCHPKLSGKPSRRLNEWFNTACYTPPGPFEFGNEPRVDPYLRAQGIDTTDFSAAKDIAFHDRYRLDIRAEFFNLFNWTQFAPPNNQADNTASFGQVYSQVNQPRLVQFSGRFTF